MSTSTILVEMVDMHKQLQIETQELRTQMKSKKQLLLIVQGEIEDLIEQNKYINPNFVVETTVKLEKKEQLQQQIQLENQELSNHILTGNMSYTQEIKTQMKSNKQLLLILRGEIEELIERNKNINPTLVVETREKLETKKQLQQQLQLETQELSTQIESKNQLQLQLQIQIEILEDELNNNDKYVENNDNNSGSSGHDLVPSCLKQSLQEQPQQEEKVEEEEVKEEEEEVEILEQQDAESLQQQDQEQQRVVFTIDEYSDLWFMRRPQQQQQQSPLHANSMLCEIWLLQKEHVKRSCCKLWLNHKEKQQQQQEQPQQLYEQKPPQQQQDRMSISERKRMQRIEMLEDEILELTREKQLEEDKPQHNNRTFERKRMQNIKMLEDDIQKATVRKQLMEDKEHQKSHVMGGDSSSSSSSSSCSSENPYTRLDDYYGDYGDDVDEDERADYLLAEGVLSREDLLPENFQKTKDAILQRMNKFKNNDKILQSAASFKKWVKWVKHHEAISCESSSNQRKTIFGYNPLKPYNTSFGISFARQQLFDSFIEDRYEAWEMNDNTKESIYFFKKSLERNWFFVDLVPDFKFFSEGEEDYGAKLLAKSCQRRSEKKRKLVSHMDEKNKK
jgi:hypothetical protein